MRYTIQAACGCHTGKKRRNNEDNFCFGGKCLERENEGLVSPIRTERGLKHGLCFAVFDGMGGENFGEYASYAAARQMQLTKRSFADFLIPERAYLERLSQQLNDAVVQAQKELFTDRMGSTMVGISFTHRSAYICNVGDSRAYRFRDGEFLQLSADHVELLPGRDDKKAPLTQYLGFGSEEIRIEPHIAKSGLKSGDMYLLCSDGLTDMLTDLEISDIMRNNPDAESCVKELIHAALENGGRDNITTIVCTVI